jgi:hypothetical protein
MSGREDQHGKETAQVHGVGGTGMENENSMDCGTRPNLQKVELKGVASHKGGKP